MSKAKKLTEPQLQLLADVVAGEVFVSHGWGRAPTRILRRTSLKNYNRATFDALRKLELVNVLPAKYGQRDNAITATPLGRAIIMQMMGDVVNELGGDHV